MTVRGIVTLMACVIVAGTLAGCAGYVQYQLTDKVEAKYHGCFIPPDKVADYVGKHCVEGSFGIE